VNGSHQRPLDLGLASLDLDTVEAAQLRRRPAKPTNQAGTRWLGVALKLAPLLLLVLGCVWIAGPVIRLFSLLRDPPNALNRIATTDEMEAVSELAWKNARANQYCPTDLEEAISRPHAWKKAGFDPLVDSWDVRYLFVVHSADGAFSLVSAGPDRRFAAGDETEFNSWAVLAPKDLKRMLSDWDDLLVQKTWRD
jgi:hypothetical protein